VPDRNLDRPASACLSSRIPMGHRHDRNGETIEQAKKLSARWATASFACASTATGAHRIAGNSPGRLRPESRGFTAIFKAAGFHYVTLDLEGYRQGSLNAGLK